MVASYNTIERVLEILVEKTDLDTALEITNALKGVEGNRSFVDSVIRMEMRLREKYKKTGQVTEWFKVPACKAGFCEFKSHPNLQTITAG